MEEIFTIPESLNTVYYTYVFLSKLQFDVLHSNAECVILDFQNCKYVDATFMAFIGGLIPLCHSCNKILKYRLKTNTQLYTYFQRSGLYEYMTKPNRTYINKYAIPFSEIHMDEDSIIDYINKILELAPIILSDSAQGYLFKNIYEIFSNSSDHSEAHNGVFACGHWMPQKKYLAFSVYDTGIGIPTLIKKKINYQLTSSQALKWALETGNSTKQLNDGTPRGLGLSDLLEFIGLNEGALYILSNDVYYRYDNGTETFFELKTPIIGTLISVIIISDNDYIYSA